MRKYESSNMNKLRRQKKKENKEIEKYQKNRKPRRKQRTIPKQSLKLKRLNSKSKYLRKGMISRTCSRRNRESRMRRPYSRRQRRRTKSNLRNSRKRGHSSSRDRLERLPLQKSAKINKQEVRNSDSSKRKKETLL